MCSYNALNGVPTCASSDLLTKLAREEYGFDGYITGDCGAAADVWTAHAYGGDAAGAAAASISAGMDVDCGSFVQKNGMAALNSSKLTMDALDKAVGHLFRLRIRLGYFDPPSTTPWGNASHKDINYTEHYAQALRAAQEGIVLLENKRGVLPLQKGKTVAIAGPNANNSANMQGIDCHGVPPYLINPVEALKDYATVHYSEGCSIQANDTSGFAAAAADASNADAAVLVLGLDPSVEYEMRDRTDLLLPGVQAGLVEAVRKAMGPSKPLVLVLMGGGVIDTAPVDSLVDAILWVGYPGQSGGTALAQVLYGEVIPSGRSPLTWYPNDYAADSSPTAVDALDMSMRPGPKIPQVGKGPYPPHGPNLGRTYRFYPGTVRYPFGYGATYGAQFTYTSMDLSVTHIKSADVSAVVTAADAVHTRYNSATLLTATVSVRNVGRVAADHSVLVFASPPRAGVNGTQLHGLIGFERVRNLAPGAREMKVHIPLTAWSLALADEEGTWGTQVGSWNIHANNGTKHDWDSQVAGSSVAAKLTVV
jgi:beta-D-xylosidase 4